MYRPTPTPQQMITHSEVPGYSGLFVLGFQERHVNFYSQQVRALNLALALELENRLEPKNGKRCRVCVVGGGAGGTMAAAALAMCGCDVTIFESHKELFPFPGSDDGEVPKGGTQRTIHPHLMHWPYITGQRNNAGLPFMNWDAGPIDQVLKDLRRGFQDIPRERLREKMSTDVDAIWRIAPPGKDDKWHATFEVSFLKKGADGKQVRDVEEFDLVVLATGFGKERRYPPLDFWSYWNPELLKKFADKKAGTVLVSGTGDGGVEDAIQLALNEPEPVHDLLKLLFKPDNQVNRSQDEHVLHESVKALKSWLMETERQAHAVDPSCQSSFLKAQWDKELKFDAPSKDLEAVFDEISKVLRPKLKSGDLTISLNSTQETFHSLGASVVHRFILHCIEKLHEQYQKTVKITYIRGELVPERSRQHENEYVIRFKGDDTPHHADLFIVRHGPKLGFESVKFEPATMATAIRELRTRNVLDQTRFPMWPIYGNPKRFARFEKYANAVSPQPYNSLSIDIEQLSGTSDKHILSEIARELPLPENVGSVEFVYIPGGTYTLGQGTHPSNPQHDVKLKGFWISRYPITVAEYMTFVEKCHYEWPVKFRDIDILDRLEYQSKSEPESTFSRDNVTPQALMKERGKFIADVCDHPITDISWIDAMHFCHWAGFSLPTGAQWEAACTGHANTTTDLDKTSPHHTNEFSFEYSHFRNTGRRMGTASVKTYAFARSPFGVVQPLGNIWEFCLDAWEENPKHMVKAAPPKLREDPISINDSRHREFRGGSWFDRDQPNPFHRGHNHDRNQNGRDGFRVVWINPNAATDEIGKRDDLFNDANGKTIAFPNVENNSKLAQFAQPGITYLATPALRRLHAVEQHRGKHHTNPHTYLTLGMLKYRLKSQAVDIVLGSYNVNITTEQRCLALSCDAWHLSELTLALRSLGPTNQIRTVLADEVKLPLSNTQSAVIAFGSGSVNAVSESMVKAGIVPCFEQPTTSCVFGDKTFFANPSDSLGCGILVAYEEAVNHRQYIRILAAGRSGYATAAAIELLARLLHSTSQPELDALPLRLLFKVQGSDAVTRYPGEWQDFGTPKMNTLVLEEATPIPGQTERMDDDWQSSIKKVLVTPVADLATRT